MHPEWKQKWIEALLSGKYDQGQGQLKGHDMFCCLGVLCDISGMGQWVQSDGTERFKNVEGEWNGHLPFLMKEELGISAESESVLMKMNDGGMGFHVIANYIKNYL